MKEKKAMCYCWSLVHQTATFVGEARLSSNPQPCFRVGDEKYAKVLGDDEMPIDSPPKKCGVAQACGGVRGNKSEALLREVM